MRLVAALFPAATVTLALFGLMQYLISSGRQELTLPDYPGFVNLIRVTPETAREDPRHSAQRLPGRPAPAAETPPKPPLSTAEVAPPSSSPLSLSLPRQLPVDLGEGPTLLPFDTGNLSQDNSSKPAQQAARQPMSSVPPQPDATSNSTTEVPAPAGTGNLAAELPQSGTGGNPVVALLRVEPAYPRKAARNGDEGWVKLEFTITEQGTVVDPVVLDARPRRTFNRSAVAAIRQWRFKARVVDGKPVATRATQIIEFKLAGR